MADKRPDELACVVGRASMNDTARRQWHGGRWGRPKGRAVMGSQLPSSLQFGRVAPASMLIAILWLAGVFLLGKSRGYLPWQESGEAPGNQEPPQGHSKQIKNQQATAKVATLIAGQPVLPQAHKTDIYLTGLGILLTAVVQTAPT
jgi:hypothetical protein